MTSFGVRAVALSVLALSTCSTPAHAQRADENVIRSAEDAFGTTVGLESIGLYNASSVRGFSPTVAGNVRIEGLYFDQQASVSLRVRSSSTIKVGAATLGYPFPAPTGIVDIKLRPSGKETVLSPIVGYGPFDGWSTQLDGQFPLSRVDANVALGASYFDEQFGHGGSDTVVSAGVVPRWKPTEAVEITGFWARVRYSDQLAAPLYVPAGEYLPTAVKRGKYIGPDWDEANGHTESAGLAATAALGAWTLKGGIFHSADVSTSSFANIVAAIEPDGSARRLIISDPPQRSGSSSGELRASRVVSSGQWRQLLLGSVRWRDVTSRYGGSQRIDGGAGHMNVELLSSKPFLSYGPRSSAHVDQKTVGLSYGLRHGTDTGLEFSLQKTLYDRTETLPGMDKSRFESSPWLTNLTLSRRVAKTVMAYASYTQGLEDSGSAPDAAANRGQPLPAIRTRQHDIGIEWSPADAVKVVATYFEIRKPYLTNDQTNVYRALAAEIHRGGELSMSATPMNGLTLVAGAVVTRPRVRNAGQAAQVIGRFPVAQPSRIAELNVDYTLPRLKSLSLDARVTYTGPQYSTDDNLLRLGGYSAAAVGGRYKFRRGDGRYTLRVSMKNVSNHFAWTPISDGVYRPLDQRAFSAFLSADLY